MDSTTEALTPRFHLLGFVLALVGGAVAAGATGYLYFLVANKAGVDYIIAIAAILGWIVGTAVGLLAKVGQLRAMLVVLAVAFVLGVAGYAARYFFEFNDFIDTIVREEAPADMSPDVAREILLQGLAEEYPPGGLAGYLQILAEAGFSIGSRGSENEDAPIKGTLAYGLLGIEALAAGIVAGAAARSVLTKSAAAPVVPSSTPTQPTG